MRVVIVEDQTMIRSLLESYFLAEDGNQIVASIPGAKQAVEVCRALFLLLQARPLISIK